LFAGLIGKAVVLAASVWGSPPPAIELETSRYLPGALYQLEQAKVAAEEGNVAVAQAYTRLVLHDQGLKVFVDLNEAPSSLQEEAKAAAREAVDYWNETIGEGALTLVESEPEAQVRIVYRREVTLRGIQVGGYCSQSRGVAINASGEASSEYFATIFARYELPGGKRLNGASLKNIVAHEIGHIYGLNDCTEPDHLMSALNPAKPKFDLHADEMTALRNLRLTSFGIQRSALMRSREN
jgi:predicted Zn-dependent protease